MCFASISVSSKNPLLVSNHLRCNFIRNNAVYKDGLSAPPVPSYRCINIRVGSVGGEEAHQGLLNHTYNNTAAGNAPPDSESIPDLGGHRVRCILNSFPSNKAQTERSESGNPTLSYTRLFMRTLSVDLVSSLQAPGAPVSLNPSPPK